LQENNTWGNDHVYSCHPVRSAKHVAFTFVICQEIKKYLPAVKTVPKKGALCYLTLTGTI
jgi:hypothetical protein